jgi:hypothetical protein
MAHAYTPGLKVTPRIRHQARRVLPIAGEVLVKAGDRVAARDVVAQTFLPGDVTPINLSNQLSVPPAEVPSCMLVAEGATVSVGDVLARTKGMFGFFKGEYRAKAAGTIESISAVTGQVILRGPPTPVQVLAFLTGTVAEVLPKEGVIVEADTALVQGIFGVGGEAYGPIRVACSDPTQELTAAQLKPEHKGCIVIGGARMTGDAVRRAIQVGAAAVVSGGMDDQDLKEILGHDLGVAITGSEQIGTTLIITEGFGEIAMARRTFELLKSHEGRDASVNGATQIRAGVMRPEIIVCLPPEAAARVPEPKHTSGLMSVGTSVRVIRDPWFGALGTVAGLPPELRTLGSGSKARTVDVRLDNGETISVPRANVELIEV